MWPNKPHPLMSWVLEPYSVLLLSCEGASTVAGIGSLGDDGPITARNGDATGTWSGMGKNGPMSVTLTQSGCTLKGSAVYQPCVPVTAIEGNKALLDEWSVKTVDGSLTIRRNDPTLTDPLNPREIETTYVFTNTQNRPNCPDSETGTFEITSRPPLI